MADLALAPGQTSDGPPGAPGQAGGAPHMPPPPLPLLNTNPTQDPPAPGVPSGLMSPMSAGGTVRRAAPEPNKRALYVGGLDPRVTEDVLKQIFETTGHVQNVKIIPDKNSKGFNYGFVEYDDPGAAERAMQTLNGRRVHNNEVRVNWAYQSTSTNKEDTSNHYHIFVGDLSNEVNDEVLLQAFAAFGGVSEARVMWDMKTGRSRGYGFVAYRDKQEAEKALAAMNGEWLGSRAIRCNWANQKGQPSMSDQQHLGSMGQMGMTPTTPFGHHQYPTNGTQSYDMIVAQTPQWQTTVYVGNLTPYTTQNDLIPLFQNFGYVVETRFQSDRGFAFVKMDTHENASNAICSLSGYQVNGRGLKCSWGKDRPPASQGQFDGYSPQAPQTPAGYPQTPAGFGFPQYGGPQGPMSPQGPAQSPHQAYGFGAPPGYGSMPGSAGMPPGSAGSYGSAGGYGRGHHAGPPQPGSAGPYSAGPPAAYAGYGGYHG